MRLIDADALISFIDSIDPEHLRHSTELTFSESDIINMLNHAPTAFDIDEVVERIENIKKNKAGACFEEECGYCKYLCECWNWTEREGGEMRDFLALDKAIEVIKGEKNK